MNAAALRHQADDDATIIILPFTVTAGGVELPLFLNVQKVAKVVELTALSPLPEACRPFVGLHDEGGVAVPVIDLGAELARRSTSSSPDDAAEGEPNDLAPVRLATVHTRGARRLLICEVVGLWVGLIVEQTRKVRRQPNASIEAPPRALAGRDIQFLSGMLHESTGFRYMLDLEGFLASAGVPVARIDPTRGKSTAASTQSLRGRRLLLVEDSALFQALARNLFTREGAELAIASDGEAGLARLLEPHAHFDLVIADIEMPRMNGLEMIRRYRQAVTQPSPVLFHSAISNPALAADIVREGLGDYVPKFEERTILAKVQSLIKKP